MTYRITSQGTKIDIDKCVEQVGGNRFNLVLIASARSRELSRQNKFKEVKRQINAPVTALLEIQEGKINKEYLKRLK